jgi:ABC-type uncharacterized transport system permease subunit
MLHYFLYLFLIAIIKYYSNRSPAKWLQACENIIDLSGAILLPSSLLTQNLKPIVNSLPFVDL